MKRVAVIPARGGSKRLPRKNVLPFLGRPIIVHTIDAARQTELFERVVVSTEDDEIASVAKNADAEIDRRNPVLATDVSTVAEVCIDFLEREYSRGHSYDVLCVLYATAPLRTADDIAATVSLVQPGFCDYAMAVCEYSHYAHQALRLSDDSWAEPMWPDLLELRSDALPSLRAGNGSTYAVAVEEFRHSRVFYGPRMRVHEMPRWRSTDIDTAEDLAFARWFASEKFSTKRR